MRTSFKKTSISVLEDWDSLSELLFSLEISRSKQKKIIQNSAFLKKKIYSRQVIDLPIDLLNKNMVNPLYKGKCVLKIQDNELFMALSKPVQIHSLPLSYSEQNNILSYVRDQENCADIFSINKDSYEKGLLYRLDYETSGLIMLAKDKKFYEMFRQKILKNKFYLAVVEGEIDNDFSYAHYIDYFGEKGAVGHVSNAADANSHLEGKKIIYNAKTNQSLVLIKLDEGKRHQIRVQLSAEGYPILGDPIYSKSQANRMYLHSFCYRFEYKEVEYQIIDDNFSALEVIFNTDGVLKMAHQALLGF